MRQSGSAICTIDRTFYEAVDIDLSLAEPPFGEVQAAENHGQHIVEVVGDASGQLPHGFHLLGLAQLLFGFHAFGDFVGLIMDQLVNQAAKTHYMSGGKLNVPMVLRTTMGAGRRSAAQHSQSLHAWLSHIPGLKVVVRSTPYDAKGLMKSAIRDDNPVAVFEDKMMYRLVKGPVPEAEYTIPLGVASAAACI